MAVITLYRYIRVDYHINPKNYFYHIHWKMFTYCDSFSSHRDLLSKCDLELVTAYHSPFGLLTTRLVTSRGKDHFVLCQLVTSIVVSSSSPVTSMLRSDDGFEEKQNCHRKWIILWIWSNEFFGLILLGILLVQLTLVISNSIISNNRLSRIENLVPAKIWTSNNRQKNIVEKRRNCSKFLHFSTIVLIYL